MDITIDQFSDRALHAVLPLTVINKALRERGALRLNIPPAQPTLGCPLLERRECDVDGDEGDDGVEEPLVCLMIAEAREPSTIKWVGFVDPENLRAEAFSWLDVSGVCPLSNPIQLPSTLPGNANPVNNAPSPLAFAVIDLPPAIADAIRREPLAEHYFPVGEIEEALQKLWPKLDEKCRALLRYIADPPEPLTLEYAMTLGYKRENAVHRDLERTRSQLAKLMGKVPFLADFVFCRGAENGYQMDRFTRQAMRNLGLLEEWNGRETGVTDFAVEVGNPTTALTTAETRLGQGSFRQSLLDYWNGRCSVTGCAVHDALLASHIVPWEASNDRERLDPFNGLLLVANLDKLFDAALITFDDSGRIHISPHIPATDWKALGLSTTLRLRKFDDRHLAYLKRHHDRYEQRLQRARA